MKKNIIASIVLLLVLVVFGAGEEQFVSSKTSEVFHKLNCRYAAKLNVDNADYYKSYEEAEAAGKRPCKTCKPTPTPIIEPPEDPNIINIIPSREAVSFFPTDKIVIQSEYCGKVFDPNYMNKRIMNPTIISSLLKNVGTHSFCSECSFTPVIENAYIAEEYKKPVYIDVQDENDPNIIIPTFSHYEIDPNCPVYLSDQSVNYHYNSECIGLKSIPVHMVNLETGAISGSDAFWNSKQGLLEWRITPIDMGDYVAVMNSDVGQTQLLAITTRTKTIPDINTFSKYWLKGNVNFVKFAELSRNLGIYQNSIKSSVKIEWVFEDGRWVPTIAGEVLNSTIDADVDIVENVTENKETMILSTRIAPYQWRDTLIKEVTTKVTTYEGYDKYSLEPQIGSIDYLNYAPYTDVTRTTLIDGTTQEELLAYYIEIGMPLPPEKVEPPQDSNEILTLLSNIQSFEPLDDSFKEEAINSIMTDYDTQKTAYGNYIKEKAEWDKLLSEKEKELMRQMNQMEHIYPIYEPEMDRYEEENER